MVFKVEHVGEQVMTGKAKLERLFTHPARL